MKALLSSQKGDNMTKLMGQNAIIADEQIIELYWQREERAIQETDKNMGSFYLELLIIFFMIAWIARNVKTIHILECGTLFLRQDLLCSRRLSRRLCGA